LKPAPRRDTHVLIQAAQTGDRSSIEELFSRYRDPVLELVGLMLGRARGMWLEDEEDIVQDTLLEAFRSLPEFESRSEGAFMLWLAKLAENNLRDAVRRRTTLKRGEDNVRREADMTSSVLQSALYIGREPSPSEMARAAELASILEQAVIALPERERRVYVMRKLCGLSNEEVAAELGLGGPSSASSLYSRTLAKLSAALPALDA
jgi:RNA polymerase sigma-70 factor, ECF subfamily